MFKCFTPCIYYHEKFDRNQNPCVRIACIYKDRKLRNIPKEEIERCSHFKMLKDKNYYMDY